jgi:hypothetical protein
MAFVHHTMLTAENLRGLPSKQLHTNVEPHYSPRSRAAPTAMWGGGSGRCLFEACDWRTFWPTIRISLLVRGSRKKTPNFKNIYSKCQARQRA